MAENSTDQFFKSTVLGHPSGLFVLFFTEMWERFSYYGMRALLVMFFTASLMDGGWGWPREHAFAIFGTYTSLVYLSTLLGGYFADKIIGFRYAVVVGALLMTLGHACMALESSFFIYLGLTLLVFGSGFFKPNMTSIISEMYKDRSEKKDGAYTIFYMGVNAGAFLGILLCGYLGEKVGWNWGFGLAGIFMLFGLLQFWFAQDIFGKIGLKPEKIDETVTELKEGEPKLNPFTKVQLILIVIAASLGLAWILNDPVAKISEGEYNLFDFSLFGLDGPTFIILSALILFILLLVLRLPKYEKITRDRMLAVMFFAFITIFFWAIFEQAPSSLTIFARDYTQRVLEGNSALTFKIVNSLMTLIPLGIISWVLWLLFKQTFSKCAKSNMFLTASFVIIWAIAIWMINNDFNSSSYMVNYNNVNGKNVEVKIVSSEKYSVNDEINIKDIQSLSLYNPKDEANVHNSIVDNILFDEGKNELAECFSGKILGFSEVQKLGALGLMTNIVETEFVNSLGESIIKKVKISKKDKENLKIGDNVFVKIEHVVKYESDAKSTKRATVSAINNAVEIPASWFGILNSLFIIAFAPLFSKWWESKYNPNANMKYAIGMTLLGIGMACVAIGSSSIPVGAKTASVSMIWLILVYFFHTMGELCVSPVALSYVSKLVPGRMIAMMFGVWYLAVAIGMKLAGVFGEASESIAKTEGLSHFFWLLTVVAVGLGVFSALMYPVIKKLMHGVR